MTGYICIAIGVLLCAAAVIWSRRKHAQSKASRPPINWDALFDGKPVMLYGDEALIVYSALSHGVCVDYTSTGLSYDASGVPHEHTIFDVEVRGERRLLQHSGPAALYLERLADMTQSLRFITDPAEIEAFKRKETT